VILAFALPPSLRVVLDAANNVYRTVLMLPEQASTTAAMVDSLHYFEITVYTIIAVLYMGTAVYFLVRFRRRTDHDPVAQVEAHGTVVVYAGSMFGIFLVFWLFGFLQFRTMRAPPANATDVYVTAKQWTWKFAYSTGGASVDVLYVPVHEPIRLLLTSRDVIHSFWVPAFRLKQDAVPGTYTTAWFEVKDPGAYQVMCTQMCGAGHARMWAQVVALDAEDYEKWRRGELPGAQTDAAGPMEASSGPSAAPVNLAGIGRQRSAEFGCLKCHTVDGQQYIGPTWLGLYGSEVVLDDGSRTPADAAYLTESMMDPAAKIVKGFTPVMPSFQGLLSPGDTAAIIEYMKSLRDAKQPRVVSPPPVGPVYVPAVPVPPPAGGRQ
jgi:cytochrome c oxidase subunit 2